MSNNHPKQAAETKYLNPIAEYLPIEKIAKDYNLHDEMPYLIEDGIDEIEYNIK